MLYSRKTLNCKVESVDVESGVIHASLQGEQELLSLGYPRNVALKITAPYHLDTLGPGDTFVAQSALLPGNPAAIQGDEMRVSAERPTQVTRVELQDRFSGEAQSRDGVFFEKASDWMSLEEFDSSGFSDQISHSKERLDSVKQERESAFQNGTRPPKPGNETYMGASVRVLDENNKVIENFPPMLMVDDLDVGSGQRHVTMDDIRGLEEYVNSDMPGHRVEVSALNATPIPNQVKRKSQEEDLNIEEMRHMMRTYVDAMDRQESMRNSLREQKGAGMG